MSAIPAVVARTASAPSWAASCAWRLAAATSWAVAATCCTLPAIWTAAAVAACTWPACSAAPSAIALIARRQRLESTRHGWSVAGGHVGEGRFDGRGAAPNPLADRNQHRRVQHHEDRVHRNDAADWRVAVIEHGRRQHFVEDDVVQRDR